MKIGIVQTAPNNCAALDRLAQKYSDVKIIHFVDGCLEICVEEGLAGTEKCHSILIRDFKALEDAGCDRLGLLCSLVKPGIEKVRPFVSAPIICYDDVQAEKAVEVTPNGGRIAVIAMNTASLAPSEKAVHEAAARAGKKAEVTTICVEAARECLAETGRADIADQYFERYLREHQDAYHAFVIPQIPMTRIMPKIRDLRTPVFDSIEPFLDRLINDNESGLKSNSCGQ